MRLADLARGPQPSSAASSDERQYFRRCFGVHTGPARRA